MKNYCGLLIILCLSYPAFGQVKFIIESLPETTPAQDSIYLTGTFNDWNTSDPKYLLQKQPNGQLEVVLYTREPVVEYKFTRGDWLKVETGENNQYLPNRILAKNNSAQVLPIRIRNWQDLGGARSFEYLTFYFFSVALLAFILLILSLRIFKKEHTRQRVFAITHGLMISLYFGAVAYYVVNPIWQTYLIILSEAFIFLWGPMLYLFVKSIRDKVNHNFNWNYFIPAIVALFITIFRLMNMEAMDSFSLPVAGFLTRGKLLMVGTGTLMTFGFLIKLIVEEKWHLTFSRLGSEFLALLILVVSALGLCLLITNLYLESQGISTADVGEYKWFFVTLSSLIWAVLFALWHDPQFFKEKTYSFQIDNADELLGKLHVLVQKDKIYHEAELNVNRLADLMETKPHILSKLLNEHFEQNFRDFVNSYRVKEFIELANEGRLEKLTFLGLAHEVGFNSKSTFNLAFKKMTRKSPREYFKSLVL